MTDRPRHPPSESAVVRGVLVTGGSRGIGRAVATAFAARGHRGAVHHASSRAETTLHGLAGAGHVAVRG